MNVSGGCPCGCGIPTHFIARMLAKNHPSMTRHPDPPARKFSGAIRLFRLWRVTSEPYVGAPLRLRSLVAAYEWGKGLNRTVNDIREHGASALGLGFYGFKSYGALLEQGEDSVYSDLVGGTILCWGKVVVAEQGARCEKAKIESLISPNEIEQAMKVLTIANDYGARVISEETAHNLVGGLVPYQAKGFDTII